MKKLKSWKQTTKKQKQYGKRNLERYQSDFMTLDERFLKREEEDEDDV